MSAPTQGQTSVLIIGLDLDWGDAHLGHKMDMATIRASVTKGLQEVQNVPGLHATTYFFVPDESDTWGETERKIRGGHDGKPWDGVGVGWGLRAQEDMTEIFERVVDLVREASPASKLIFAGPASDHFAAVKRNWPHLKGPEWFVVDRRTNPYGMMAWKVVS